MVPIIPKLHYYQWLKYIHLSFGKSIHLAEFSMLVFIFKIVCCSKKKFSRDLCSPGSRQFLSLQLFPKFLKFWTLLLILSFLDLFWIPELCCHSATSLDFVRMNWGRLLSFNSEVEWLPFVKLMLLIVEFKVWIWKWGPFYLKMVSFITIKRLFMCELGR